MALVRPGKKPGANGGIGCVIIFLIPFFLVGIWGLFSGLLDLVRFGFGGAGSDFVAKLGVGAIFTAFSSLFLWLVIGGGNTKLGGAQGAGDDWRESPVFPKLKRIRQGEKGMRLAPDTGPLAAAIGLGLMAAFWNGITYTILFMMIRSHSGWTQYLLLAFISIFVIVGLLMIYGFVHQLFLLLMVGKTPVEISTEPVRIGEKFKVHLFQPGSFAINSIEVKLICKESVTYQQGTDTRTDHHLVHEEIIVASGATNARSDGPVLSCEAAIPNNGTHSLQLPHNRITWAIAVKIDIPNRPDVSQEYQFRVLPEYYG